MDTLLSKLPYTEYCERQGNSAWSAEPVNAVTTIALLISAYYIFKLLKKKNKINDKKFIFLPLLLAASAFGNVIYHTLPNPVAYLADVVPLGLFWLIISYLIKNLLFIGLGFIVAVYLRSLDQVICNNFTIGSHFVLHILIAIAAYYAVKSLLTIYESEKN